MSEFYDFIDQRLGDSDAIDDIILTVRRCWKYDFDGYPVYLWQGNGKLFTSDGQEWLGSIDGNGTNYHKTPALQDGRDGSSATYTTTLNLIDLPGQPAFETYNALKADQWRVSGRKLTCYLIIFDEKEGLRPQTPIVFFKELIMMAPKFSEKIDSGSDGRLIKRYSTSVTCKDGNFGRTNTPNGTYADTVQKERARQLGVALDRGCEFVALLANRTYQIP